MHYEVAMGTFDSNNYHEIVMICIDTHVTFLIARSVDSLLSSSIKCNYCVSVIPLNLGRRVHIPSMLWI